tara:strand:+ start:1239 stop:2153 length:915 start_codon:yes stop_codon:yes gene_type:complete
MSIIAIVQEEVFINEIGKIIYNPEDLLVYASGLWTGLATATVSLIGMVSGSSARNRAAYRARLERDRLKGELKILEDGRQTIKNPYAGVTDISGMAKDLSSLVSNPFASLGVATQAAEIQIEEADIALANTLDTLRATGASAGGATALAQAALQSKKGVSASIEKQEAENERMKAKGEAEMERLKMAEAQRMQNINMTEAARLQQADVAGRQFMFSTKEARQMQELNRKQALITGQAQMAMANQQGSNQIMAAGLSALGNIGGAMAGSGAQWPSGGGSGSGKVTSNAGVDVDPFTAGGYYDGKW